MAGGSGGPAADSFHPEPGVWGPRRGRNEWAGEAEQVRLEKRLQMRDEAQVRHGVLGDFIHSDKDCLCGGRESRSVGLVPCFHSMSVETPSPSWS